MSKKLMLPFLTEWLIKNGTNPTNIDHVGTVSLTIFYKAIRNKYLIEVSVGQPMLVKLTREGINYLKENQK
jgi:hypothetical protein